MPPRRYEGRLRRGFDPLDRWLTAQSPLGVRERDELTPLPSRVAGRALTSPTKVLIHGGNPGAASPTQCALLTEDGRRIATVLASEGWPPPSGPPGRGFSPVRWRRPVLRSKRAGVSVANSALSYDDGVETLVGVPSQS